MKAILPSHDPRFQRLDDLPGAQCSEAIRLLCTMREIFRRDPLDVLVLPDDVQHETAVQAVFDLVACGYPLDVRQPIHPPAAIIITLRAEVSR